MPQPITRPEAHLDTSDAAALYFGEVMHARLKPMGHRFSYRVMSLLIDLDRLEEADRQCLLFGGLCKIRRHVVPGRVGAQGFGDLEARAQSVLVKAVSGPGTAEPGVTPALNFA